MKKEVSPAIMGACIVLVVLVIGFIGYKTFGPKHATPPDEKMKAAQENMHKMMNTKPGEMPPGMTIPARH